MQKITSSARISTTFEGFADKGGRPERRTALRPVELAADLRRTPLNNSLSQIYAAERKHLPKLPKSWFAEVKSLFNLLQECLSVSVTAFPLTAPLSAAPADGMKPAEVEEKTMFNVIIEEVPSNTCIMMNMVARLRRAQARLRRAQARPGAPRRAPYRLPGAPKARPGLLRVRALTSSAPKEAEEAEDANKKLEEAWERVVVAWEGDLWAGGGGACKGVRLDEGSRAPTGGIGSPAVERG
ncbi:hypothetical protein KSP39_PZI005788 [Platanthera zijinensis]|uniref:Uncharacterized protein n=1 Tax=Platanthera zijinensis TaxID=2320716 RepID=A0AAP0BU27_9ASPA